MGQNGFVTLRGKEFIDVNGNSFYPLIMNTQVNLVFPGTINGIKLLSPASQYDVLPGLDCFNQPDCDSDLLDHFTQIKNMGFNCVRIMNLAPRFVTNYNGFTGFTYSIITNSPYHEYFIPMNLPYSTNNQADFLLDQYEKILQIAAQVPQPFYVIFNTLNYFGSIDFLGNPYDLNVMSPFYLLFLAELSSRLSSYQSLLGYDLFNEPHWFETMDLDKQQVCDFVNTWSSVINANCPHLVTLNNYWIDAVEWEPGSMKVDFYSIHYYTERYSMLETNSTDNFNNSIERFKCISWWFMNYCPMPWIVGEVAFSSKFGHTYPEVDGNNAQQADFASQTLEIARNCGASGYSWWLPQETSYEPYQDGFGLLYNVHSFTEPPSISTEKPAVSVFRNYLNSNNQAPQPIPPTALPGTYFDPFQLDDKEPGNLNAVSGTLHDQYGGKVNDGLLDATMWLDTHIDINGEPYYKHLGIYEFTNGLGEFSVEPYNYYPWNPPKIVHLRGSSFGTERFLENGWPETQIDLILGTLYLDRNFIAYDLIVNDEDVTLGDSRNFIEWNSVSVSNTHIHGNCINGGVADFTARDEIKLLDGFFAECGSEVMIQTMETYPICSDFQNYYRTMLIPESNIENGNQSREISISFINQDKDLSFEIFPNPSSGKFSIEIREFKLDKFYQVAVFNSLGKFVYSTAVFSNQSNLDFCHLTKGFYIVRVSSEGCYSTEKIVIN
jgi:hypothetical protein